MSLVSGRLDGVDITFLDEEAGLAAVLAWIFDPGADAIAWGRQSKRYARSAAHMDTLKGTAQDMFSLGVRS
jgi:hypothetical protein